MWAQSSGRPGPSQALSPEVLGPHAGLSAAGPWTGPCWKDSGLSPGRRAASPAHGSGQSPWCWPSRGPAAEVRTLTWAPQGGLAWGALPTPSSLWFVLGLASSSHRKGKGRPRPLALTRWMQTQLQNTGPFEGDGQTSWNPGGARPSSLPGGLRAQGRPSFPSPGLRAKVGQPHLLLGVGPRPLPGETHARTHLQVCTHTHLLTHTQVHTAARPSLRATGSAFWGAHPSALPLPLCFLPSWELRVSVCV